MEDEDTCYDCGAVLLDHERWSTRCAECLELLEDEED